MKPLPRNLGARCLSFRTATLVLALAACLCAPGRPARGDAAAEAEQKKTMQNQAADLITAATAGNATAVAMRLAEGIPADAVYEDTSTGQHNKVQALHYAARGGHVEVVKALLEAGAKADAKDSRGVQPIHFAARGGHLETAKLLLAAGAKADAAECYGQQPIHMASLGGHLEMAKFLLAKGAKKDAQDTGWMCEKDPIHYAVEGGHPDMVKFWLGLGIKVDVAGKNGFQPIHFTTDAGMLKFLVAAGAKLDAEARNGLQPIHVAAYGHADTVKYLLEAGCKVEGNGKYYETPLMVAASSGDAATVKALLAAGAKANAISKAGPYDGWPAAGLTPLHFAAQGKENPEIVKLLVDAGAPPNALDGIGRTALHCAVAQSHVAMVKALLAAGCDPDIHGKEANPLLLNAITVWGGGAQTEETKLEIVKAILAAHAKVDAIDRRGRTLLMATLGERNGLPMVRLLLAAGAKADAVDREGRPAFFYIATEQTAEVFKLLLEAGAKVDACDKNGVQPIHLAAASFFNKEMVPLLLEHGAKADAKDAQGCTPLIYMADGGSHNQALGRFMMERGMHDIVAKTDEPPRWGGYGRSGEETAAQMKILLAAGAKADETSNHGLRALPALMDCWSPDVESMDVLLKAGASPNATTQSPEPPLVALAKASDGESPSAEAAARLLLAGAKPDGASPDGMQALHFAAQAEKTDLLDVLLNAGAKAEAANREGWRPLHFAAQSGSSACIAKLLEAGAKAATAAPDGLLPLHLAARSGDAESVKGLLAAGAKADAKTRDGRQPLHFAASGGHLEAAKLLAAAGAETIAADGAGRTPLILAAQNRSISRELMELLMKESDGKKTIYKMMMEANGNIIRVSASGVRIHPGTLCDREGLSPIHHAAKADNIEAVRRLLAAGCKNAKTKAGLTALHFAAKNGNREMTNLLLRNGADRTAKADDGTTPADLAKQAGHAELATFLSHP